MTATLPYPFRKWGLSERDWLRPRRGAILAEKAILSAHDKAPRITTQLGESITVVIDTSGSVVLPAWLASTVQNLWRLLDLPSNWDSYGAQRIESRVLERALKVLLSVLTDKTPEPAVVPASHGGVQFEWHTRGIDLEVELYPAGESEVYWFDHESGEEWEGGGESAIDQLERFVGELSTRALTDSPES